MLDVGDALTLGDVVEQCMLINRLGELNNTQQELLIEKIFQCGTCSQLLGLIAQARSQQSAQDLILIRFHEVQNLSFTTVDLNCLQTQLTMLPDSEWKNGLLGWLKAYRRIEAI